jgi:hypothetical protein
MADASTDFACAPAINGAASAPSASRQAARFAGPGLDRLAHTGVPAAAVLLICAIIAALFAYGAQTRERAIVDAVQEVDLLARYLTHEVDTRPIGGSLEQMLPAWVAAKGRTVFVSDQNGLLAGAAPP